MVKPLDFPGRSRLVKQVKSPQVKSGSEQRGRPGLLHGECSAEARFSALIRGQRGHEEGLALLFVKTCL